VRPVHDTGGGCVICPMEAGLRVLCGVDLAPRDAAPNLRLINGAVAAAGAAISLGAQVEATPWLGSRPSTPDGLPIIGLAPRHPGLVLAMGHGHIGLSTGPITGRIVADLLAGVAPPLPIAAFSPERF
jgi:D-amino-acid dehydrogenase